MRCSQFEELFTLYIDDDLDQRERDAIRFHLNGCVRCRTKLSDMEQTVTTLRSAPAVGPRNGFDQALHSRIMAERTGEIYTRSLPAKLKTGLMDFFGFLRRPVFQLAFSASIALTIAYFALPFRSTTGETEPKPMVTISIPEPIEAEPAFGVPLIPEPIEARLAPVMAVSYTLASESNLFFTEVIDPKEAVRKENVESIASAAPNSAIITIPTMESRKSLLSMEAMTDQGAGMSQEEALSLETLQGSSESERAAMSRFIMPAAPSKRITRISF